MDYGVQMVFDSVAAPDGNVGAVAIQRNANAQAILKQVHTALEVLKCFRGVSSATYREGNATVTHFETVIRDLKK